VRQLVDGEVDSADSGWYGETKLKEALVEATIGQAAAMLQLGQHGGNTRDVGVTTGSRSGGSGSVNFQAWW
jgi:hypothetical protein